MPSQVDQAIAYAEAQIGDPYVWGATGPNSFDCSGLVQAAYAAAGVKLPRTTYQQVLVGAPVTKDQLQPGDLVFPDAGHVQIYVGNGKVVEAPRAGLKVREVPMWGFWKARRVASGGSLSAGAGAASGGGGAAAGAGSATGSGTGVVSLAPALGSALTKTTVVLLAGGLVVGGLVLATRNGMAARG